MRGVNFADFLLNMKFKNVFNQMFQFFYKQEMYMKSHLLISVHFVHRNVYEMSSVVTVACTVKVNAVLSCKYGTCIMYVLQHCSKAASHNSFAWISGRMKDRGNHNMITYFIPNVTLYLFRSFNNTNWYPWQFICKKVRKVPSLKFMCLEI